MYHSHWLCGRRQVDGLSMAAGLNGVSAGGIILAGRAVSPVRPDRGMVYQAQGLVPWLTAFDDGEHLSTRLLAFSLRHTDEPASRFCQGRLVMLPRAGQGQTQAVTLAVFHPSEGFEF
jgi:ABC-type taurine transport system ATPase subunit